MEEKSSKKTLLLIGVIVLLLVAVVGVSFAFFSYIRQGTKNNYVTTGTITFTYAETSATKLTLENEFPQAAGYAGANHDAFEFTVSGNIPSTASTVYYKVTAVEGAAVSGKTKFNSPTQISIKVGVTNAGPGTATIQGSYASGAALPSSMTSGVVIAKGSITNTGALQTHTYTLKMWVNSSVTISDTDTTKTYRAKAYNATSWPEGSSSDTRPVYSNLYYSLKVNVEARDSGAY